MTYRQIKGLKNKLQLNSSLFQLFIILQLHLIYKVTKSNFKIKTFGNLANCFNFFYLL